MKKVLLSLALSFTALVGCARPTGGLKDVSLPYLGTYECVSARLGTRDLTSDYSFIRLELSKEEYLLVAKEKSGGRRKISGTYRYDAEEELWEISDVFGGRVRSSELKLTHGKLILTARYGDEMLIATFEKP